LANELENTREKIFWVNQNKNISLGLENQNHLFFFKTEKKAFLSCFYNIFLFFSVESFAKLNSNSYN